MAADRGGIGIVFFASALAWMVLPHHHTDWSKLPDEAGVRTAVRGLAPGEYSFPHAATSDEWKSKEWIEKATPRATGRAGTGPL